LSIAALIEEIGCESVELPPADALHDLLCGLAPWLRLFADAVVRVEGDSVTLHYEPDAAMTCAPRYGGSEEA
jgi:hypothetical protein